ncbi:MAG: sulfite exporter TauE/SafE family protein [Bacteroidota bacterium]
MLFWTAFLLGIGGSLHCMSMCGPLVLAVPGLRADQGNQLTKLVVYHSGRVIVYALIGLIVGSLGWGLQLVNFQGTLAIATGLFIIGIALFKLDFKRLFVSKASSASIWQRTINKYFSIYIKKDGWTATLVLGMLNGLIPCGLVYVAIISAVNVNAPLHGALYLLAFGLGTMPLLFATSIIGKRVFQYISFNKRYLQQAVLVAVGLIFIWRGLNFNFPEGFFMWYDQQFVPMCH